MTDEERGLLDAVRQGIAADLSIYADWLDEHPDPVRPGRPLWAHALRWCVARMKRPHVSPGGRFASWRPAGRQGAAAPDRLPRVVYDQLTGGSVRAGPRRVYGAHGGAPAFFVPYVMLGLALRRLREAYEP